MKYSWNGASSPMIGLIAYVGSPHRQCIVQQVGDRGVNLGTSVGLIWTDLAGRSNGQNERQVELTSPKKPGPWGVKGPFGEIWAVWSPIKRKRPYEGLTRTGILPIGWLQLNHGWDVLQMHCVLFVAAHGGQVLCAQGLLGASCSQNN